MVNAIQSTTSSPSARFTLDLLGGAAWFATRVTGMPLSIPQTRESFTANYQLMTEDSDSLSFVCPPGIVWQWTLEVSRCGEEPSAVGTRNVRCTRNMEQPPCCMPGYEVSPADPYGGGCMKTHEGLDTRLHSPPCFDAKGQAQQAGGGLVAELTPDYEQQMQRFAKAMHDAPPTAAHPAGAGALIGGAAALLVAAAAVKRATRHATLL